MKKQRIVIASILKPLNDTRMVDKIGGSLAKDQSYEIHVIGYPALPSNHAAQFHFYPLATFKRLSFRRLFAPVYVARLVLQVKPQVLIITTHELLIVSFLFRIFFGVKIVYDVQENYYRNILYSGSFASPIKYLLAGWVRAKEVAFARFIDWFFLAERGYQNELSFIGSRYTVLENKSMFRVEHPIKRNLKSGTITCLFTGTLSESTGVFAAIDFVKSMHEVNPSIKLSIIGYTPLESVYDRIRSAINEHPFIELIGGNSLVPHTRIWEAIQAADLGLICYPVKPHTELSVPTKLYEYLSAQLPIIIQNHPPWVELCRPFSAALPLNFESFNASEIWGRLATFDFYSYPPTNTLWIEEEPKLLAAVQQFVSK